MEEGGRREAKLAEVEEELRSELNKARATLERTNKQLAELDADNCSLRERVSQGEEEVRNTLHTRSFCLQPFYHLFRWKSCDGSSKQLSRRWSRGGMS